MRFKREYWIGHYWVDFALDDFFLVIEADGRLFHGDPRREDSRDEALKQRGWQVLHVYGPNIINESTHVIAAIKQAVRSARPRPIDPEGPPRRDVIAEWDDPKPKGQPARRRQRYRHRSIFDEKN